MKEHKKTYDFIAVIGILIIACILYIGNQFLFQKPAAQVEISVDGTIVSILDLSKDTELTVTGYHDGTNLLIIKDGEVRISEASCPDQVCVHQGKIHLNSDMIVCLPNKMIAKIIGGG